MGNTRMMAIQWSEAQRKVVFEVLHRFPARSHCCEDAARAILPIARERDVRSRGIRIEPAGRARYILPKVPLHGDWWRYHITIEAERHYVDALTGVDGTATSDYFEEHWQYPEPEAYVLSPVELTEPSP